MRTRTDDGAVTAEAAMVIPVLVVLSAALSWLVCLGVAQVRVVDAAREAARSLARSQDESTALALGRRVAPDGADFTIRREAGTVEVIVTARVRGPGGVFEFLPGYSARATAVAQTEPDP